MRKLEKAADEHELGDSDRAFVFREVLRDAFEEGRQRGYLDGSDDERRALQDERRALKNATKTQTTDKESWPVTVRNVYLDCEFLAAVPTLNGLVSIGLCDDNGNEYYAVNQACDWQVLVRHDWMRANVVPSLPLRFPAGRDKNPGIRLWDKQHPDYAALKKPEQIAVDIAAYFADTTAETTHLWAWCGGQDICRLHLLWNNDWQAMPEQVPRWFNEIEQLRWQAGNPELPEQDGGAHNALSDARHNRTMREFLIARLATRGE
jgi:hypothetical protein